MAGNGKSNARGWRQFWAAILFFLTGVAFLLLAVFGPVVWGDAFDSDSLKTPAWGLIIVSVYVLVGVSIPALLAGRGGKDDEDAG